MNDRVSKKKEDSLRRFKINFAPIFHRIQQTEAFFHSTNALLALESVHLNDVEIHINFTILSFSLWCVRKSSSQ